MLCLMLADGFDGKVGGADGYVKQAAARGEHADGLAAPRLVDIQGEEMVQGVVCSGYAVKEMSDIFLAVVQHDGMFVCLVVDKLFL